MIQTDEQENSFHFVANDGTNQRDARRQLGSDLYSSSRNTDMDRVLGV